MNSKREVPLQVQVVEAIFLLSKKCFEVSRECLKPKKPEPIVLCFAVYIFSRLDMEVVHEHLTEGLRSILYDEFLDRLFKAFRAVPQDTLRSIMNEQMDRYGEIYRTKSGDETFQALHNYLEMLLEAAALEKKPTLWRMGKDAVVIADIRRVLALRGALAAIEKEIVIPKVKDLFDALVGQTPKPKPSEIRGVPAIKIFFRETKEWQVLPEAVTDALAEKLEDQKGEALIELLHVSYTYDLIETIFKPICEKSSDIRQVIFSIGSDLYRLGKESYDELMNTDGPAKSKERVRELYVKLNELWRTAIVIDPTNFLVKMHYGYFFNMFGQVDDAIHQWNTALSDIETMRKKAVAERSVFEDMLMEGDDAESLHTQMLTAIEEVKAKRKRAEEQK